MLDQINILREKGQKELKTLTSIEQLRDWHQQYLSKRGNLTSLLKQLGNISAKERPVVGKVINEVKREFQDLFELSQKNLLEKKLHKELDQKDVLLFAKRLPIKKELDQTFIDKLIPNMISNLKYKNILSNAVKNNNIAHFWTHPHNFITAPESKKIFEQLCQQISKKVDSNQIEVRRQEDFI